MKRLDLTGQKYGRLTVQSFAETGKKIIHWKCLCECGGENVVSTTHLRSGHTSSCGCYSREVSAAISKKNAKHGMWNTPEFSIWGSIIDRCCNEKCKKYPLYGGRGITICAEWKESFFAFFRHIGPRPSNKHSIDRIDNDKGYEPGNVRWATLDIQNNNRRNNVFITVYGIRKTIAQWSKQTGISESALTNRLKKGWAEDRMLSEMRK